MSVSQQQLDEEIINQRIKECVMESLRHTFDTCEWQKFPCTKSDLELPVFAAEKLAVLGLIDADFAREMRDDFNCEISNI